MSINSCNNFPISCSLISIVTNPFFSSSEQNIAMPSSNSNPFATIVNHVGYDVDIYDVYNNSGKLQGLLTYTKLATVLNGTSGQQVQTIHLASQLQAMRTGNIPALNNNYYQQFPVAVMGVSPFNDSNSFTLTNDSQQGMEESFRFIKYAQANPSSQLATSFRAALVDPTSQKTAVDKFFQGTGSFKHCTLATWSAVVAWQAQFTSAWQGTYYLYSLGDSSDAHTKGPSLVSTLTIEASAQNSSAVLAMAGTDNESAALAMVGDGTMQEQDAGTGNLSVALTPSWLNVTQNSQQNGKAVVNYVIGVAFSGTINGVKVAGNLNKLALPDPSDTSKKASEKSSAFQFSLSSLFSLLGLLAPIGMLAYQAKSYHEAKTQRENENKKRASSKDEAEEQDEESERKSQSEEIPELRKQGNGVELSVSQVPKNNAQWNEANRIPGELADLSNQEERLAEAVEDGAPNQADEDAAENVGEARAKLMHAVDPNTSAEERAAALEDASQKLADTKQSLSEELAKGGEALSTEAARASEAVEKALNEVQEQEEAAEQNEEQKEEEIEQAEDEPLEEGQFEEAVPEATVEV